MEAQMTADLIRREKTSSPQQIKSKCLLA